MPNPDKPSGFRASPLGNVSVFKKDASSAAIYPGDMFIAEADGFVDVAAAGSTALVGSAVSYAVASVAGSIRGCDDPSQVYIAQDDGSATPVQDNVTHNCDIVATAGSSALNQSRQEIDISSAATTAAQMRMLEVLAHPEYALGINSLWKCVMNEHYIRTTTAI